MAWRVGGTLAIAAAVFGLLAAIRALRARGGHGPHGARPRGAGRPAHDVPRGARRDRGGDRAAVARAARGLRRRPPAGGRVGLPRAGDRVGRAGLRGDRRPRLPVRAEPPRGAAARRRGRRRVLHAAGGRRHRGRRRLAALGDAAGLGRGAAPLHRRRAARPGAAARGERAAAGPGRADRGPARHRHRACCPPTTRPRRGWRCSPRRPRRRCAPSAAA